METSELKKQLIEMIECINDEELLYTLREDVVFHVTTRNTISQHTSTVNEETHTRNIPDFNNDQDLASFGFTLL